jgi:hypothetical protein
VQKAVQLAVLSVGLMVEKMVDYSAALKVGKMVVQLAAEWVARSVEMTVEGTVVWMADS